MTCWLGNHDCDAALFSKPSYVTRLARKTDAAELAELVIANKAFQKPYEPYREPSYYSEAGQRFFIERQLEQHAAGTALPLLITDDDRIVGRITLSGVVRGPMQSGTVGYWVSEADNARGLATLALHEMLHSAFDTMQLHRVEAGTLTDNLRSQRVLEHNGFARYGFAPRYLYIDGDWRDHILFQRINSSWTA